MSPGAQLRVPCILALCAVGLLTASAAVSQRGTGTAATQPSAQQPIPPVNPPQTEAQRKAFRPGDKSALAVVNAFDQQAFFDHDPVGAMKKYLADDFIERYPDLASPGPGSDKQKTIRFFETRGWKKGEGMQDTIYQVIADRDHVAVFHHTSKGPNDRGTAWVDIFRVKDGLIVEHWAVGQPVSDKVSAQHSMF